MGSTKLSDISISRSDVLDILRKRSLWGGPLPTAGEARGLEAGVTYADSQGSLVTEPRLNAKPL